jgi:CHAT domain-containing protein/tetratricopeptide (TPR) repeat protein
MGLGTAQNRGSKFDESLDNVRQALQLLQSIQGTDNEQALCRKLIEMGVEGKDAQKRALDQAEQLPSQSPNATSASIAASTNDVTSAKQPDSERKAMAQSKSAAGSGSRFTTVESLSAGKRAMNNNALATALFQKSDYKGAIKAWKSAIADLEQVPRTENVRAEHTYNIGVAWLRCSQHEEVIQSFRTAAEIYASVSGQDLRQAECYYGIGVSLQALGRDSEAIVEFRRALSIYESSKTCLPQQASCHEQLGLALNTLAQSEEALREFRAALSIIQNTPGYTETEALLRVRVGEILVTLRQYGAALDELNASLVLYQKTGVSLRNEIACYTKLGLVMQKLGRQQEALKQFQLGLDLCTRPNVKVQYMIVLSLRMNVASQLCTLGRYREAIEQDSSILASLAASGNPVNTDFGATVLMNRGDALRNLGQYEDAIVNLRAALAVYNKQPNNVLQQVACLANLSSALNDLGQLDFALAENKKALSLIETGNAVPGCLETRNILAIEHSRMGDRMAQQGRYVEALAYLRRALALSSDIPASELNQMVTHCYMSDAFRATRDYDSALREYQIAKDILQTRPEMAKEQDNMERTYKARILIDQHKFSDALKIILGSRRSTAGYGNLILASAYEGVGGETLLREALRHRLGSIQSSERERQLITATEFRITWFEKTAFEYSKIISLLFRMKKGGVSLSDPGVTQWGAETECAAFHFADSAKGRALEDALREKAAMMRSTGDMGLLFKNKELSLRISKLSSLRVDLPESDSQQRTRLTQEIDDLQQQRNMIEVSLKKTALGDYVAPAFRKPMEMARDLDADTAVLQYSLGEEEAWLLILTRTGVTTHKLGVSTQALPELLARQEATIEQLADAWKKRSDTVGLDGLVKLARMRADDLSRKAAERLNLVDEAQEQAILERLGTVVLPITARAELEKQKIGHLLVIPDGSLNYIPFGMLRIAGEKENKRQYLIERFAVSSVPAMTTLETLRRQRTEREQKRKIPRRQLLSFANPDFGSLPPNLELAQTTPVVQDDMLTRMRSFRTDNYKGGGLRLTTLPETEQEAMRAASLFGPPEEYKVPTTEVPEGTTVIYAEKGASEEQVKRLLGSGADAMPKFRYMLFSTHGFADTHNGMLSCVALSTPQADSTEDGYLQAQEVMNLELDTDVVMLSACQTGLGRLRGGEGLVGLSAAFFYAGAESICASLWQVPSGPTSQVVTEFFKHLQEGKTSRAESLRQAQLSVLRQGRTPDGKSADYSTPFCWAAFVLMGEYEDHNDR